MHIYDNSLSLSLIFTKLNYGVKSSNLVTTYLYTKLERFHGTIER